MTKGKRPDIAPWWSEFFRFLGGFVCILGAALLLLFVFQGVLS